MFARTPRLVLRPGWTEDASALAAALGERDVLRNLPAAPGSYSIEDAHRFLTQPRDPRLPDFLAFARTGGAPRLVGGAGVALREDGKPELRYWIARPFWGLGFATEATRAVLHIARATSLGRLIAAPPVENKASANVLRKLGFRPTGRAETRYSAAHNENVKLALYEEDAPVPMREDSSLELYLDRAPIAA
jgi:RimJ/RimL family protein N-acetyltransferase